MVAALPSICVLTLPSIASISQERNFRRVAPVMPGKPPSPGLFLKTMTEYAKHPDFPWYLLGSDGTIWRTHSRHRHTYLKPEMWRKTKQFVHPNGWRLCCCLGHPDKRRGVNRMVAILMAQVFVPNPENLPFVCFKDNDPYNCQPENLYWSPVLHKFRRPRTKPIIVHRTKCNHSEAAKKGRITRLKNLAERRKYYFQNEKPKRQQLAKEKRDAKQAQIP